MSIPFPKKKEIGSGTFGTTYLIDYHGVDAVLKWPKDTNPNDLEIEAERMMKLHSRYCVHIIDVAEKDGITGIVMEYCPHRSLKDVLYKLKKEKKRLSERGVLKLFCEMVLGLKYLHDHNVLHLDLKPDNIFITQDNMCVLGDFGLSQEVKDLTQPLNRIKGTPLYFSPEQILLKESYYASVDIFSLGLILYEMCVMETFYCEAKEYKDLIRIAHNLEDASKNPKNVYFIEKMNKIPKHIPKELKDIIVKCLQYDSTNRPTIDDIYHEEIIQDFIQKGIKDFLNDYDIYDAMTLKNNWSEMSKLYREKQINKVLEKKDIILYLLDHYKHTDFIFEEEKEKLWELIYFISRNIGYQLLLNPHTGDNKIKCYKTEEYEDLKELWEHSDYVTKIFPKILEYLYYHRYNDEADAIVEALCKERIKLDVKNNCRIIVEKYRH